MGYYLSVTSNSWSTSDGGLRFYSVRPLVEVGTLTHHSSPHQLDFRSRRCRCSAWAEEGRGSGCHRGNIQEDTKPSPPSCWVLWTKQRKPRMWLSMHFFFFTSWLNERHFWKPSNISLNKWSVCISLAYVCICPDGMSQSSGGLFATNNAELQCFLNWQPFMAFVKPQSLNYAKT